MDQATPNMGEKNDQVRTPHPVVVSRLPLHKGRKFDYEQLLVRGPSGREHTREVVRHPGAVVVVGVQSHPIDPPSLVLIRVYRASLERACWECCAGTLEAGEDPAECAARELTEETGYQAGALTHLATFHTSPGLSDERMHAFVATDLRPVGQRLEPDEDIQVHLLPVARVLEMIDSGEIADGKSIAAILLALRRGLIPQPEGSDQTA